MYAVDQRVSVSGYRSKMQDRLFVLLALVLQIGAGAEERELCFQNFKFGVATAAYQVEGAWNVSGKGESIWDRYTHERPDRIFDHQTGDVAADSYHLVEEDVRLLVDLGVQFYRFSISWPRILPSGFSNKINPDGVRYYNKLLDLLNQHNILPVVTMYHWDLPQTLQQLGGWTNPLIADHFVSYARVLFENFGPRVKTWLTFNEPLSFCQGGYGGIEAPGFGASGTDDYLCAHTVLRAHGMVFRMYDREFRKKQQGNVGITLDFSWPEPLTTSKNNQIAAEIFRQFSLGWFAHPIFSETGDYPPIMRKRIDYISKHQHFPRSRLPKFTPQEVEMIKGSADFLGFNHYTTYLVEKNYQPIPAQPSFDYDIGGIKTQKDDWPKSNSTWLKVVPWGFRKALNWVRKAYNNPPIIVTENGVSTRPGTQDLRRINYIEGYLKALHSAIYVDGCDVRGYTYWSLIDNFEWTRGFSERFGLYEVDYASPNKTRTKRLSAAYIAKVAKTRCLPQSWTT
ncbi:myrosinase 1-like [Aricia agestis]|uniref:myrosinase 1-like n=1 Tax=Aricia agestis TaxID=91739 RepID=UPI001C20B097|nr:myrosinase 1-like [Aricia agestis]